LPRLGPRRETPQAGRDERALARDGRHAEFRPVQPRPADLCRIEVERYRKAVRAAVTTSSPALCAIAHWGGRSSIPETSAIQPRSRGVLDAPPSRGMTGQGLVTGPQKHEL